MADKISFDLVSPERRLVNSEADMVVIPGMEGDFGAMPNHAPVLSTLRPGLVTVHDGSEKSEYVVTGGFAEVSGDTVTVLAEQAVPRADATAEWLAERTEAAERDLAEAPEESRAAAALRVDDFRALSNQL